MNSLYVIYGVSVFLILLLMFIDLLNKNKFPKIKKRKFITSISTMVLVISVLINAINLTHLLKDKKLSTKDILKEAKRQLEVSYPDKIYNPNKIKEEAKEEFTKQSAVDELLKILQKVVDKDNEKSTPKVRFDELSKDNKKYKDLINSEVLDRIHLEDDYNNDNMYANTSLALLSISSMLSNENKEEIKVKSSSLNVVYLEKTSNTAHIPLDIFAGRYTGLDISMVFVDNHWKLSPYSMMKVIQLSDYFNSKLESQKEKK